MKRTLKTRAASPASRARRRSRMERVCTALAHWTGTNKDAKATALKLNEMIEEAEARHRDKAAAARA